MILPNIMRLFSPPDKTFIDLGAGSGVLCYQALKYGAKKIYAFEGNSRIIGDLKDTFKDNKEVEVVYGNFDGKLIHGASCVLLFLSCWFYLHRPSSSPAEGKRVELL